jgi:dTDP-4-amino-4,6-dideoxygalactose transaminase
MTYREIPPVKLYFPPEDITRIKEHVETILKSGMLTLGHYTREFEAEWAKLTKAKHAVAVNSGTAALEIALRAVEANKGDEVIVPTNTFTATAATVIRVEATPVLADIDPKNLCITADEVQKHITSKTKAVIAVHTGGLICPEIKSIREICNKNGIFLIEDAAHAHGSTIDEQSAGSLGDIGCFSFYPTKVMTTGEGGMVITESDKVAEEARILRDQGKESFSGNAIVELGHNWRMQEISAAIGLVQLKRLPEIIAGRRKVAKHYDEELRNISAIRPLEVPSNIIHNYYKYVAFLKTESVKELFRERLRAKGVKLSGEVYWPPLHLQPIYRKLLGTKEGDFPQAEIACNKMVCLPIYAQMTTEEMNYVTEKIAEVTNTLPA